jgi:hypothetical protein
MECGMKAQKNEEIWTNNAEYDAVLSIILLLMRVFAVMIYVGRKFLRLGCRSCQVAWV